METHPDRAYQIGLEEAILQERFREVHLAYEQVISYIREPNRYKLTVPSRSAYRFDRPVRKTSAPQRHHYYQGEIPARRIFIGQYLYYLRLISMRQMWDAVVWQKVQRPRLGDIALQLRLLTHHDLQNILRNLPRGELFGEFAQRTGLLSFYQVMVLVGRQKSLQPRIGSYFIDKGIILPNRLDAVEEALKAHNRRHWFKK